MYEKKPTTIYIYYDNNKNDHVVLFEYENNFVRTYV